MDVLREILLPKLDGVKMSGGSWMARCPAHEDGEASLHISRGDKQPVVLKCHADCEQVDILTKLGLTWDTLCNPREERQQLGEWTPHGDAEAVYPYHDENGTLLFQVLRAPGKRFVQRRPDLTAKSGWTYRLGDTRRVLFHLPQLLAKLGEGYEVWIAEGEKDVLALERHDCVATCNSGGAGKWREEYNEYFRDAIVHIVADRDEPGQRHARHVFASLQGVAAYVEIVEAAGEGLPDGRKVKDAADHFEAGHTVRDFVVTHDEGGDSRPDLAPDLHEFLAVQDEPYDWLIPGVLERGDRLIWTGGEGNGKALALDTPIPTPKGWTTMGALSVGDEVFAADGSATRVIATTPVMTDHDCYRVRFSDGAEIVADADHQWLTETLRARECAAREARRSPVLAKRGTDQRHKRQHFPGVVTTQQIHESLMARDGHAVNHSIAACAPLQYARQELPVDPYVLGAWLGDGTSRNGQITSADPEIIQEIRAAGEPCRQLSEYQWSMTAGTPGARNPQSMSARLRAQDLIKNKHIPLPYQQASPEQRLALLQGLMDTDGTITAKGSTSGRGAGASVCEFSVVSERLARDVHELLLGLGVKVRFREGRAVLNGRHIGARYRLSFQTDLPVFRLKRKAERLTPLHTRRANLRYITAVEPVASVPVRCIQVDNPDRLYLAGRECIPTHNSVCVRMLCVAAAAGLHPFRLAAMRPCKVLFIDLENSERKTRKHFRTLEAVARKRGQRVPDGNLRIICRPEGINVLGDDGAAWLLERVTAHKPDLLYVGSFYRMHEADMNDERAARRVTVILDQARARSGCAVITEAHSPHGDGLVRAVRPIGSSLLMRWPELGFGIRPAADSERAESGHHTKVEVVMWRGPRDDEYRWPQVLTWGSTEHGDWPWVDPAAPPFPAYPHAVPDTA